MARDELNALFGEFDRYSKGGGKGGDAAKWIVVHGGRPLIVDRKTGQPRTIYVPRASVSITGTIQPGTLKRALSQEHRESGLAARLLFAWPPRRRRRWTEESVSPALAARVERLFERLYELRPGVDRQGAPCPVDVALTPEAKCLWVEFYNEHAEEHADLTGDLSAAWSKLEGYAARLALVVHLARWAGGEPVSPEAVDAASMQAGVTLSRWFAHEAKRVYAMLAESGAAEQDRRLAEWISRRGGRVTARQVQQGHRSIRTSDAAEAALEGLVKRGYGHWEPSPAGQPGQPTRWFVLDAVNGTPPIPPGNPHTVDVDRVAGPAEDAEWGDV